MTLTLPITRHLTDGFADLFGYVMAFRQTAAEKQPAYDDVRQEILRLLKESEAFAAKGFYTPEDYDQARYAVCAWIDESILASTWTFKGRWRPEPLQRMYYQSSDAGEKFFQRLKGLEAPQQAIREVYYLCLALGFKGRYCAPDDQYALDQLKDRHLKWLFNSVAETPSLFTLEKNRLFPEAYVPYALSAQTKRIRRPWGWMTAMAAPCLAAITLFLIYRFALYSVGAALLKAVRS